MFTTILCCEKGIEGYPHMLITLLIFSGWLLWFYQGQSRGSWSSGWLLNGLFGGLTFYCGGWTALLFYFLPMMFLKRPFTPWRRLNNTGFPAGMLILTIFIMLWLIPHWSPGSGPAWIPEYMLGEYFLRMIKMPLDLIIRFFPWIFFLYAPFCPALIEIDHYPLFSKYLRVLFVSTLILGILNPFSTERDMMILLPVFSLMVGLNYTLVVRRYGDWLCRQSIKLSFCLLLFSAVILLMEMMPEMFQSGMIRMNFLRGHSVLSFPLTLFQCVVGILFACAAIHLSIQKKQVWLIFVFMIVCYMQFFWTVINPNRAMERSRREMGITFKTAIGANWKQGQILYKDDDIEGLYPECFYSGARILTLPINKTGSLKGKEIYLLTVSSIQPTDSSRVWTKILDTVYKKQNLYMWKGTLNDRKDGPENDISDIQF